MNFCVYVVVNKINGKMYVGGTEISLEVRLQRHIIKANQGSECSLSKAIRKYGKDNFDIRMIEKYDSREEMFKGEINWIAYFDTYKSHYGYNDTAGGEGGNTNGGKTFSPEWKSNLSRSQSGKERKSIRKFSDEVEKEICRLYVEEEKSTYSLAKQFGCYSSLILSILDRNNIIKRESNYTGHDNGCNIFTNEQELEICKLYVDKKLSRMDIAKIYKCGKTTIRDVLLRNSIKL